MPNSTGPHVRGNPLDHFWVSALTFASRGILVAEMGSSRAWPLKFPHWHEFYHPSHPSEVRGLQGSHQPAYDLDHPPETVNIMTPVKAIQWNPPETSSTSSRPFSFGAPSRVVPLRMRTYMASKVIPLIPQKLCDAHLESTGHSKKGLMNLST